MRCARRLAGAGLAIALGLASAAPAQQLDERALSLRFAQGIWRAPLVCQLPDGSNHQALRRLLVKPGPRAARQPLDQLTFFDLQAPPGTRCQTAEGHDEPNILGTLRLTSDARTEGTTGDRDLRETLRREGAVVLQVSHGALKLLPPGGPDSAAHLVDFAGGTARFEPVRRGSDSFRRLAEYGEHRKLALRLTAPDGTALSFDLVDLGGR